MMKELNHINFDEWLFSYFEGTLNAEEKQRFTDFINANPSLKENMDLMDVSFVSAVNVEVPKGLEKQFMKIKWYAKPWAKGLMLTAGVGIVVAGIMLFKQKEEVPFVPESQPNTIEKSSIVPDTSSTLYFEKAGENHHPKNFQRPHQFIMDKYESIPAPDQAEEKITRDSDVTVVATPDAKIENVKSIEPVSVPLEKKNETKEVIQKKNKSKADQEALDSQLQ
jgi:hypothetical protein